MGKYLVYIGLLVVVVGGIIWLLGDKLSWLGRLPGDIRIEKENLKIFFPITTMIILSVVLSVILWLFRKFF